MDNKIIEMMIWSYIQGFNSAIHVLTDAGSVMMNEDVLRAKFDEYMRVMGDTNVN
jgi:hypothetical protein